MITQFQDYLHSLILRIIAAIIIISPLLSGLFYHEHWIIIQLIIGVAMILEFYKKSLKNHSRQRISWFDALHIGLVAIYFISIIWGLHKHGAYVTAFRYLSFYFFYFLVVNNVFTKKERDFLVHSIFGSAVLSAIVAFLSVAQITLFDFREIAPAIDRVAGSFNYPNTFGIFMALGFILGMELLLAANNVFLKKYIFAGLYLVFAGMVASMSRGVFLFLIIFILMLFIYRIVKRDNTSYFFFSFLVITLVSSFSVTVFLEQIRAAEYNQALLFLGMGMVALFVIAFLSEYAIKKLDAINKDGTYKTLFFAFVVLYILGIGVVYFNYLSDADPLSGGVFVDRAVAARLSAIDGTEASYTGRMTYNKDALKVMLSHPFGTGGRGWDSAYHQHQEHEYWSTEVHNAFLQTGVETGFAGLILYLGIWGAVFYGSYLVYRQRRGQSMAMHLGITVALALLLSHSAMDFNFSYGSMQLIAMTLAGLIMYSERSRKLRLKEIQVKPYLWKVLAVVMIPLFIVPTSLELTAEVYKKRAYQAWRLEEVIENYEKAARFSPFNEHVRALLARRYSEQYLQTGANSDYDRVNQLTDRVLQLAPRDIWSLTYLQDAHHTLKNQPRLLELRELEAGILPVVAATNAALADEYIKTAFYWLDRDNPELAGQLFEKAIVTVEPYRNIERLNPYLQNQRQLRLTNHHRVVWGKIAYLQGEYEEALTMLQSVRSGDRLEESILWQIATHIKTGHIDKGEALLPRIKNDKLLLELNKIVIRGGIFAPESSPETLSNEEENDGRQ